MFVWFESGRRKKVLQAHPHLPYFSSKQFRSRSGTIDFDVCLFIDFMRATIKQKQVDFGSYVSMEIFGTKFH